MDPDHHGALAAVQSWRPHIEGEAIFGLRADLFGDDLIQQACALQRGGSDMDGLADAAPGLTLAGRSPSSGTHGRLGERHALEGGQAGFGEALQLAAGRVDDNGGHEIGDRHELICRSGGL